MRDQGLYVLAAFAQGRNFDREGAQAIKRILAEAAFCDFLLQVAIAGGDYPNVSLTGFDIADAFKFLLLQGAEQLVCIASGTSPISSRNKLPPSASPKTALECAG